MNGYSLALLPSDEYIYRQYNRNCIDYICLHRFVNIHELCYVAYNHITHTHIHSLYLYIYYIYTYLYIYIFI